MVDQKTTKTFDLNDPEQVEITQANNHAEMYANRTMLAVSEFDVRLVFVQTLAVTADTTKLKVIEKGAVTFTHEHAKRLHTALGNAIAANPQLFENAKPEVESKEDPPA